MQNLVYLARNLRDANVEMRPCGSASEACKDTWQRHLGLHGPVWRQRGARHKWAMWIGPTGIVGPVLAL